MQPPTGSNQRRSRIIGYHAPVRLSIIIFVLTLTVQCKAQWDIEDSHTTASLRGIDSVGDGVAWASGSSGTVLRTEDGGYRWQLCAIPPGAEKLDFRGIQAFDANTAIVMSSGKGDLSRLYKTTDGCQTWKLVFTNPDKEGFWDAFRFPDMNQGFILGDPIERPRPDDALNPQPFRVFALLFTKDGGKTFHHAAPFKNGASPGQSAFAASNSALFVVPPFIAFVSGGGHESICYTEEIAKDVSGPLLPRNIIPLHVWNAYLPISAGESSGAFSIAFRRARKAEKHPTGSPFVAAVSVGGDYKNPDRSAGTAAYVGWTLVNWKAAQSSPHGYRSAVAYDTQQKLWITVGPNGTDISRDDGRNWSALKPTKEEPADADKNWNALSLPFVVGPNGRIGKLRPSALKP